MSYPWIFYGTYIYFPKTAVEKAQNCLEKIMAMLVFQIA